MPDLNQTAIHVRQEFHAGFRNRFMPDKNFTQIELIGTPVVVLSRIRTFFPIGEVYH